MSIAQTIEIRCDQRIPEKCHGRKRRHRCSTQLVFKDGVGMTMGIAVLRALHKGWSFEQHPRHGEQHYCPHHTKERAKEEKRL